MIASQLATQTHISDQCVASNYKEVIALISAWLLVTGEEDYEQVLKMKQGYSLREVIAGRALCPFLRILGSMKARRGAADR